MELKITLTPAPSFDVVLPTGEKLAPFRMTSEWNGLMRLENDLGWAMIVGPKRELIDSLLDPNKSFDVAVLKASPPLLERMMPKEKEIDHAPASA